ncbi:hypothetical protein UFOVP891_3 [uncultured Caudovirales phage]|uniref:Uncharacterized protein n=1 Tax=uncultured Caudovirales phage TaxID=2100421 RepID=A0A6J5T2B1_9CAUD|nr:hypothetical protein UFOVP472_2 [uncultured Caudovirales phage]CAB4168904.1 hypothetical protein UFOVP891_3 [uncultured Caudovirales phage]CAB4180742.1 hypothetical protein UFOVP1053_2 [uncultured Caudovirales phage]CAB4195378.1 hypothetical protein UFOVP1297_9 [uncultured Caudovirales phage]CAB4221913.1 hypothetical protein UFOVP1647_49 [uncultured Caudovirales phage]
MDKKTPGQVLCERMNGISEWQDLDGGQRELYEQDAAAVIAHVISQIEQEARAVAVEDVIAISKDGGRYLFPNGVPEDLLKINEESYTTLRALATLPSTHVVVPLEPTEERIQAGSLALEVNERLFGEEYLVSMGCAKCVYKAMIAGSKV